MPENILDNIEEAMLVEYEERLLNGRKTAIASRTTALSPIISVIVPIYNAEETLVQALDSIRGQMLRNIEIICVDDASPDNSIDIIEEYYRRDLRFTILRHRYNAGYGASMNDGISIARGQWIAIVEPDDYIEPGMYDSLLSHAMECALANDMEITDIDVIKSPYIREVREEGVKRGGPAKDLMNCSYRGRIHPSKEPFTMRDENACHLLRHHPSIWSALYSKSFLDNKGIRLVEYPGSGWADNEFFYETLLQAENIVYVDAPFYVYREETDEEFKAFSQKNKTLACDRWHSMMDIIERLGIEDECILRSHISKGFTYISGTIESNRADDPVIKEEAGKMFARMDPDLVYAEPKINPGYKKMFFDSRNDKRSLTSSTMKYLGGLIGEFVYTIKNAGAAHTAKQVKKVIGLNK